jgi:hypothetical protein
MAPTPELAYLVSHIKEALATDERTHMLDVQVTIRGERVHLMGAVTCESRRTAAEEVTRELLPPNMVIVNGICIESYGFPSDPETLA